MASGLLDFFTGGGQYADPTQVDPMTGAPYGTVRQAFFNQLGNVGAALLAAGQPVEPAVRAQLLAQMGGFGSGMSTDIYKAAQSRLMQSQYQQQMSEIEGRKRFQQMLGGAAPAPGAAPGAAASGVAAPSAAAPGVAAPGAAAPAAPASGGLQGLTPSELAYIRSIPSPKMQEEAYATLMQQKLTKPSTEQEIPLTAEERTTYNIPEGQPAFKKVRNLPDGTQAVTGYNIPNIQRPESSFNAIMYKAGMERLATERDTASAATSTIRSNEALLDLVNQGIFTGSLAPAQLQGSKAISAIQGALGIQDSKRLNELITNTEAFKSEVGRKVLSMVKDLGPNPSNADREYAADIAAGRIELNESSIRKVIEISERAERKKIESYNKLSEGFLSGKGITDQQREYLTPLFPKIEMPSQQLKFTTNEGVSWSPKR